MRRQWRAYQTASGACPVKEFIDGLSDVDAAAVVAAMADVAVNELTAARHLRGDIYEVRASGDRVIYRVLFSPEGRHGQVLLALEAFQKKTQKTPPRVLLLAEKRLADWRGRGSSS